MHKTMNIMLPLQQEHDSDILHPQDTALVEAPKNHGKLEPAAIKI